MNDTANSLNHFLGIRSFHGYKFSRTCFNTEKPLPGFITIKLQWLSLVKKKKNV